MDINGRIVSKNVVEMAESCVRLAKDLSERRKKYHSNKNQIIDMDNSHP